MKTVTAAIIIDGTRVLIARRGPGEKLAGFWEFPGGKVEEGESLQDCLKRELLEELNIHTHVLETVAVNEYRYDHGAIKLVALVAEIIGGKITPTVHDSVEWVDISILLDYKLAPADVPIAAELKRLQHLTS